jgi:hypothetical protein
MEKYGIRHIKTGEIVTYSISSNADGEFCSSNQFFIGYYNNNIWMVDSYDKALQALLTNTPWYIADYDTPSHDYNFNSEDCEIVKFDIVVSVV